MTLAHRIGDSRLAGRLSRALRGEVLFDAWSRGRYSTDASIYQIEPLGVAVPRDANDIAAAIDIAREEGVPVLMRGGGTSQCGQTVGEALVLDTSKYMSRVLDLDTEGRRVRVQPGLVLDRLNAALRPHGLFFPVDVSTGNRATLGGMAGNNSCGARSIRYGNMVHNVAAIEALMADGRAERFEQVSGNLGELEGRPAYRDLVSSLRAIAAAEADEMAARWPKLLRRVGGYNLDSLSPGGHNMAHMLVGSEGTLAAFTELELALQPIPPHKVLGVCHFPSLHDAMATTEAIVGLDPDAVELADDTLIGLAREIPLYRETIERFVRGRPGALLLVEFAGPDPERNLGRLRELVELMADAGFPDAVVEATEPGFQSAVWEVRKAGLNIMMSMKGDGKPVSFVEDCAVALKDLPAYTDRLTEVFEKHGTTGTWYAHASVGCLHVRPVLNMKDEADVKKMRAIAEEAFAMVREYKGSHSGEHGDGLVRSEFHEAMFGRRLTRAFEAVKDSFDPAGLFNPGKIVRPPHMDDRSLFRFKPGYRAQVPETVLDWSAWGGFDRAVEMCNNNGACRKAAGGVMCPSYRATGDEMHLTRGRANSLRLTLSGQVGGTDALGDRGLYDTLAMCLGCKGCRRECPTGVDMARMKTEFLHHWRKRHGLPLRDRLFAYLPRLAPMAAMLPQGLAGLARGPLKLAPERPLPRFRRDRFRDREAGTEAAPDLLLHVDCFNRHFEPENARAALKVLRGAGYRVGLAADGGRPLCCGRTLLSAGLVEAAKAEAARFLAATEAQVAAGLPVVGLEPSCLHTLQDEFPAMLPGLQAEALAGSAVMFDAFAARAAADGRDLQAGRSGRVAVHGHCHQKAFGGMAEAGKAAGLAGDVDVQVLDTGCCGMAGAFGYEAEHYAVSMRIAEMDLVPRLRALPPGTAVVAAGFSCRHQIAHTTGFTALHPARWLAGGAVA